MSNKLSKKQYDKVTKKLLKKGYTAETVYSALKDADFKISLKGETYSVYASRIIAIMHSSSEDTKALEL